MKITYGKILSWCPCYKPDKCLEMMKGIKEYELTDFLNLDSVSVEDKFWAVLRPEVIPERILHEFAIWCAESVLHLFEEKHPDDKRPRLAIEAKKKWLDGEITDKELASAASAARAAAWAAWAAWDACDASAARAAACDASAAREAARAACDAREAARDACDAACDARDAQLEQLKIMVA